jgi:hypothetical protein
LSWASPIWAVPIYPLSLKGDNLFHHTLLTLRLRGRRDNDSIFKRLNVEKTRFMNPIHDLFSDQIKNDFSIEKKLNRILEGLIAFSRVRA